MLMRMLKHGEEGMEGLKEVAEIKSYLAAAESRCLSLRGEGENEKRKKKRNGEMGPACTC